MKYNTPRQRLKVYEDILVNWDLFKKKHFGFCHMVYWFFSYDLFFNECLNYFPELLKYNPKSHRSLNTFWFPTDKIGYRKRHKILLKAIEDTKQAIAVEDKKKKKRPI